MTQVRVKGFKIFNDRHGKQRCHHRETGHKVDLKLGLTTASLPFGTASNPPLRMKALSKKA